jgi:putative transposase
MVFYLIILWVWLSIRLMQSARRWTRPAVVSLAASSLTDLTRSRTDLVAENAMLRQQLIVLQRQAKRPQLTNGDRFRLVLLARVTRYW